MNEFSIIKKYLNPLVKKNPGAFNLKDDVFSAIIKKDVVISLDTYIHKVHFLDSKDPNNFLKKIIRASLSDIISKGAIPRYYFLSFAINKKDISKKWFQKIKKILNKEQKKFNIVLSGGDTTRSSILTITVVVLGEKNHKLILRKGAKNGDDIYVTGNLGNAYIGLKIIKRDNFIKKNDKNFLKSYFEPNLCIKFSRYLKFFASSSIDISDGLFQDLEHIIDQSKVGAIVNVNLVPISKDLRNFSKKNNIELYKLISHGDDYQILFTSNKKNRNKIKKISKKTKTKISLIGTIVKGRKLTILYNDRIINNSFKKSGYIHTFN